MHNCPNCGAPLEPYTIKCEYCGTWYFDFTAIDMSDNGPHYVKFKANIGGKDAVITALAKPRLENIEVTDDDYYAYGRSGYPILRIPASRHCDLEVHFDCIEDFENKTLFTVEVEEE